MTYDRLFRDLIVWGLDNLGGMIFIFMYKIILLLSLLLSVVFVYSVFKSPYEAEFWAYRILTTLPHSLENSNALLGKYFHHFEVSDC